MGIVKSTYAELKQQELKKNPFSCLHMADIDINPHQIEAFTFALSSLELGGAILADEVGLGKPLKQVWLSNICCVVAKIRFYLSCLPTFANNGKLSWKRNLISSH